MYYKICLPLIVILNSSLAFSRPAVNQQSADATAAAAATTTTSTTSNLTPTSVTPASPSGVRQNGSGTGLESSGTSASRPPATAAPTVRDAAKQSSDASGLTAAVSTVTSGVMMGMGATYAAQCGSGPNKMACAQAALHFMMGAQAMMQAAASKAQSKDARNTQQQVDWNSGGTNADYSGYLQDAGVSPAQLSGIQRSLASHQGLNGFKLSPDGKTLTTPDGKKLPTSLASTQASMAKAGFNSAAIDGAMRAVKKAEKTVIEKMGAHTSAMGFAEAGGGVNSGSTTGSGDGAAASYAGAYGVNPNPLRDPAAASVAGLSSDFNGERIGVAQDELFQMISRRYDHKMQREGEGFLPASLLAPR